MKVFIFSLYLLNVDGGAPHLVRNDLTREECIELKEQSMVGYAAKLVCVATKSG